MQKLRGCRKILSFATGEVNKVRESIVSYDEDFEVNFINSSSAGVFIPATKHWVKLKKGDYVGDIVDPLTGEILDKITSPCDGILFTLREYPICDEGSLIARILERDDEI